MNLIEAINDSGLFRAYVTGDAEGDLGSWQAWQSFLRVLYGLPTTPDEAELVLK
jgi:hypothetical protein